MATLTIGLPNTSRVKMKLSGQKLSLEEALLALLLDDFNIFLWSRQRHRGPRPKSIFKELTEEKKPTEELMSFNSTESFDQWLKNKQENQHG